MQAVPPRHVGGHCGRQVIWLGKGISGWPGWVTEMSPWRSQLRDERLVSLSLLGKFIGNDLVLFSDKLGAAVREIGIKGIPG